MMMKRRLLVILSLGWILCSAGGALAQSNSTQILLQRAHTLEQRGRIDLAAKVWQQVLLVDPKDADALAGLARFQRQSESALAAGDNSNPQRPASAGAHVGTTDVHRGLDSLQRAKLNEAANLSAQHNPDAAMKLYKEVFGDRPPEGDWSFAYYETLAATADGSPTAIAGLRDLAKRYPDDTRYAVSLARLLTYNPHTRAEGVKTLESIPSTDAQASLVRESWRQALVWEHGNPAFEGSLRDYLGRYPDPDLEKAFGPVQPAKSAVEIADGRDEQAAYQALSDNNVVQAEELFEKLRSNPEGTTAGLIGLGYVRMKEQNFSGAVEAFEDAKSRSTAPNPKLDQSLTTSRFWRQMQDATQNLDQDHLDAALASFQQALAIQPDSPEALGGQAGTLMKQGQPATAVPVFQKWVKIRPDDQKAWMGLLRALQQSGDAAGAIAAAREMPAKVRAASLDDPEFLLPLSEAYRATGNAVESERLLQQVLQSAGTAKASPGAQAEIASVLAETGNYERATDIYVNLLNQDPEKLDVWEGLIGALHQANKDSDALAVGAKMPADLYEKALLRTDFVVMMSSIYEAQDQLEPAHRMLEDAIEQGTANGQSAPVQLQLQVAGLWLREKQYEKALDLFGQLLGRYPENIEAWRGELAAYHESHQDRRAIELFDQASDLQRRSLETDPDVLSLLAFAHSAEGEHDLALRLVRQAVSRYQVMHTALPLDLELQASWIFLDAGDFPSLYSQLRALSARTDLNPAQRNTLTDLWSAWSLKKADADAAAGNFSQSLTILTSARRAFPDDPKVHGAYASTLVRAGYSRQGYNEFVAWNLAGAQPEDYVAAVGAAAGIREFKTAESWLATSLHLWPNDPKLLMAGAKLAVARGDYGRANRYYQQALARTPAGGNGVAQSTETTDAQNMDAPTAMRHLASLLASGGAPNTADRGGAAASDHTDALDAFLSDLSPSAANQGGAPALANDNPANDLVFPNSSAHPVLEDLSHSQTSGVDPIALPATPDPVSNSNDPLQSLSDTLQGKQPPAQQTAPPRRVTNPAPQQADASGGKFYFVDPAPSSQLAPSETAQFSVPQESPLDGTENFVDSPAASPITVRTPQPQQTDNGSPRDLVENEIAGVDSQLSPFFGTEAILHGRSGQPGFDQLVSQEADIQASTTLGQSLRMTVIASPVVLDAGTPTGQSTLQLGTLPAGSTFGPMGATGLGGEMQLVTPDFGVRLGVTPQGFPIRNFTGAFVYKPDGGPIQITASRTPVTDTLLSYAGIRDPGTGQVWGGVISNGISGLGSWGSASSGFYAGLGYQYITGEDVETNRSFNGTVGSYWRVLTRPSGSLTIGLNFSGMGYAENLRYFTLGQGGYFSPQSYFLFNVPIHWGGTYEDRFEYSVDASLGSQHFQEDVTPYFPLAPGPSSHGPVIARPVFSYYPSQISTGANYSMVFKGGYHLSENWVLGGFVNVNNTLNYASQTAGFYMRFQFRPSRTNSNSFSGYLPDWNAIQPLALK